MSRRIRKFLHSIFQGLLPVQRSYPGQVTQQAIPEQHLDNLRSVFTTKTGLPETEKIPATLLPIQNPNTRTHRSLAGFKKPAQRYRDLDILLAEIKRDRLDRTQTTLVAKPVQRMARQLQRNLEQEEMNKVRNTSTPNGTR